MARWYLVDVDMDETDLVAVQEQGVYWCQWWVKNHFTV